jgi:hypothetical protein
VVDPEREREGERGREGGRGRGRGVSRMYLYLPGGFHQY